MREATLWSWLLGGNGRGVSLRTVAVLMGILLLWAGHAGTATSTKGTIIRLMAARSPGGAWSAPPVPGGAESIHLVVEVEDLTGHGWSSRTVRAMHYLDRPPAGFTWEDGYALAIDMLEAGDPSLRVTGSFMSVVEQRAMLESLRVRAKASAAPWSMDEPHLERLAGWGWRWLLERLWIGPVLVLASLPFIAMVRSARAPTLRGKIEILRRGTCPTCRYSREGFDVEAPCPECGTTLAGLEEEYRRAAGAPPAEETPRA